MEGRSGDIQVFFHCCSSEITRFSEYHAEATIGASNIWHLAGCIEET